MALVRAPGSRAVTISDGNSADDSSDLSDKSGNDRVFSPVRDRVYSRSTVDSYYSGSQSSQPPSWKPGGGRSRGSYALLEKVPESEEESHSDKPGTESVSQRTKYPLKIVETSHGGTRSTSDVRSAHRHSPIRRESSRSPRDSRASRARALKAVERLLEQLQLDSEDDSDSYSRMRSGNSRRHQSPVREASFTKHSRNPGNRDISFPEPSNEKPGRLDSLKVTHSGALLRSSQRRRDKLKDSLPKKFAPRHRSPPPVVELEPKPHETADLPETKCLKPILVDAVHVIDIVFVHGFGKSPTEPWTQTDDNTQFWPESFLSQDKTLSGARILNFTYEKEERKENLAESVESWARALLEGLQSNVDRTCNKPELGNIPLMFVAHSSGGLIVKKAYSLASIDNRYSWIHAATSAMLFLGTPHRGFGAGHSSNEILGFDAAPYSALNNSCNEYACSLDEKFCQRLASHLILASIYETRPTRIRDAENRILLPGQLATIGLPGEISMPTQASHHEMTNFSGIDDMRYQSLQALLRSLMLDCLSQQSGAQTRLPTRWEASTIASVLGVDPILGPKTVTQMNLGNSSLAKWVFAQDEYQEWAESFSTLKQILLLQGTPLSGKSGIAISVVHDIISSNKLCQYYLAQGAPSEVSLSEIVRSMIYQLSLQFPRVRKLLIEDCPRRLPIGDQAARFLWRQARLLMESSARSEPIYWIIDGLDEASLFGEILKGLCEVCDDHRQLQIFVTCRVTDIQSTRPSVSQSFRVQSFSIQPHALLHNPQVSPLVWGSSRSPDEFAPDRVTMQTLLDRFQGNLLCVRLALHNREWLPISQAGLIDGSDPVCPPLMALFSQMSQHIAHEISQVERAIAIAVLEILICTSRPFTVYELADLFLMDNEDLDFPSDIQRLCAGFVEIIDDSTIRIIGANAAEFLSNESTPLGLRKDKAHSRLFSKLLRKLMLAPSPMHTPKIRIATIVAYAALEWPNHLLAAGDDVEESDLQTLQKFLTSTHALVWIEILTLLCSDTVLDLACSVISCVAHEAQSRAPHISGLLALSVADLAMIYTQCRNAMRSRTRCIRTSIVPFLPENSPLRTACLHGEAEYLNLTGPSSIDSPDVCFDITLRADVDGIIRHAIASSRADIALINDAGVLALYSFSENRHLTTYTDERHILAAAFDQTGSVIFTATDAALKAWDISSGTLLGSCDLDLPSDGKLIEIESRPDNSGIVLTTSQGAVMMCATPSMQITTMFDPRYLSRPGVAGPWPLELLQVLLSYESHFVSLVREHHGLSMYKSMPETKQWQEIDLPSDCHADTIQSVQWHNSKDQLFAISSNGGLLVLTLDEGIFNTTSSIAGDAVGLTLHHSSILLTTSHDDGVIRVFNTTTMEIVYEVPSHEQVLGAFMDPGERCLVVYGTSRLRVWVPRGWHTRPGKSERFFSYAAPLGDKTIHRVDSRNVMSNHKRLCSIAESPAGSLYCTIDQDGHVSVHGLNEAPVVGLPGVKGASKVYWGQSGKSICVIGGNETLEIDVWQVSGSLTSPSPTVSHQAHFRTEIPRADTEALQALFCEASHQVLLVVDWVAQVYTLDGMPRLTQAYLGDHTDSVWMIHPQHQRLLLEVSSGCLVVRDWMLVSLQYQFFSLPSGSVGTLYKATPSVDNKTLLIEYRNISQPSVTCHMLLTLPAFTAHAESPSDTGSVYFSPPPADLVFLPPFVSQNIYKILYVHASLQIIFLSQDGSICWAHGTSPTFRSIFTFPSNWTSCIVGTRRLAMDICTYWAAEGAILFTHRGEVAVIRHREFPPAAGQSTLSLELGPTKVGRDLDDTVPPSPGPPSSVVARLESNLAEVLGPKYHVSQSSVAEVAPELESAGTPNDHDASIDGETPQIKIPATEASDPQTDSPELADNRLLKLPEVHRWDTRLVQVTPSGAPCWSCTPSTPGSLDTLPLSLDGIPIVVPVETHYPLIALLAPPADPHHKFIDPATAVSDSTIVELFRVFTRAVGFYILISGRIQVIVPDDFDFKAALSHLPHFFGGLRVDYIFESLVPTAGFSRQSTRFSSMTLSRPQAQRSATSSTSTSRPFLPYSQVPAAPTDVTTLKIGSKIQAVLREGIFHAGADQFKARVGLRTMSGSRFYLTIPTHLVTQTLAAHRKLGLETSKWKDTVKVVAAGSMKELGPVVESFDPHAGHFPQGFSHDVSLVDITSLHQTMATNLRSPVKTRWLSHEGWQNLKYRTAKVHLLGTDNPFVPQNSASNPKAKSIGLMDSQCQIVGQAILRSQQPLRRQSRNIIRRIRTSVADAQLQQQQQQQQQQQHSSSLTPTWTSSATTQTTAASSASDAAASHAAWTQLISRSILFRVHPDHRPDDITSGTAVCVQGTWANDQGQEHSSQPGDPGAPSTPAAPPPQSTPCAEVLGFTAFAQPSSFEQNFDVEGPRLYSRLERGQIAFFGAFQVPERLREEHVIV